MTNLDVKTSGLQSPTAEEWDVFYNHMCDPSGDEVVIMDNGTLLVSENVNVEQLIDDLHEVGIEVVKDQILICG